jgi:hypothetical protein
MSKYVRTNEGRFKVLSDPQECQRVFAFELDAQNITDSVERLTETALNLDDEFVQQPTWLAAANVLLLKGLIKRPHARPRDSFFKKRGKMHQRRMRGRHPPPPSQDDPNSER